jgi:DNA-binding winged helix-turn-helix (wHTH) protein
VKVSFGERELDTAARRLMRGGEEVPLTPKAFQLLELLVEKRPSAVSKSQIHARLWPGTFVSEVNLATLVFELRKALGDDAKRPCWLRTVRGFGYALSVEEGGGSAEAGAREREPSGRLVWRDRVIRLCWGENVLGRTEEAVALIDEAGVSRRHAVITLEPDRVVLADSGSKNGTYLNGRRIAAPEALGDGDEIGLGQARLVYRDLLKTRTETV